MLAKLILGWLSGKLIKAGQQMDVWENFRDYNLPPPVGLLRADAHRLPFRPALQVQLSWLKLLRPDVSSFCIASTVY